MFRCTIKNPTDAESIPQLMDSVLGYTLDCSSNNLSVELLMNEQMNCSIEQVHAIDDGLKIINNDCQATVVCDCIYYVISMGYEVFCVHLLFHWWGCFLFDGKPAELTQNKTKQNKILSRFNCSLYLVPVSS